MEWCRDRLVKERGRETGHPGERSTGSDQVVDYSLIYPVGTDFQRKRGRISPRGGRRMVNYSARKVHPIRVKVDRIG
jgi:hypothetical protein